MQSLVVAAQFILKCTAPVGIAMVLAVRLASAQIVTDGTVGVPGTMGSPGSLGVVQTLSSAGSAAPVVIGESLGSRPGGGANLFHSFSEFNVNTDQPVKVTV